MAIAPLGGMRSASLACGALLFLASCVADEADLCTQAADLVQECTGERPELPPEGCVGEYRDAAESLLQEDCDGLTSAGKADGFWCRSWTQWLGRCDEVSLEQAARVSTLDAVCQRSRKDALCNALRTGDDVRARAEAKGLLSASGLDNAASDPALRYYVRERFVALLVWNVVTELGTRSPPQDYRRTARSVLGEHYPIYDPKDSFEMAQSPLAPQSTRSCQSDSTLLYFPGVVRQIDRQDFVEQKHAVVEAVPCLEVIVVPSASFVTPSVNASQALRAVRDLEGDGRMRFLHLVGYSQGALNAMTSLVEKPEIAQRARSLLTLNGACHGSEVADIFYAAIGFLNSSDFCRSLPEFARPTCEWAANLSPKPAEKIIDLAAKGMGVPFETFDQWLAAEEGVAASSTLREFLRNHLPGVESITTAAADRLWRRHGHDLPTSVLYTSFRSVVSNSKKNLPSSNILFYHLLRRAGKENPHNDMQVRLSNQSMGGPVREREVVMPVAEGNHWQWELATGALQPSLMPPEMTERIPHRELMASYAQLLFELGLLD